MISLLRYLFPVHRIKYSNKAIKILIISDAVFFSGMALVEVVFSVFIITKIPGATLIDLGIGHALFMFGVMVSEALLSKFYDQADNVTTFYGFVFGNLLKSLFRIFFVFIASVNMFYFVYFLLGIVHSIEYPAFAKIFSKHLDNGYESSDWGLKDMFMSSGKLVTFFLSGFIATFLGFNALFIMSAVIMFVAGVVLPLIYSKEFTQN